MSSCIFFLGHKVPLKFGSPELFQMDFPTAVVMFIVTLLCILFVEQLKTHHLIEENSKMYLTEENEAPIDVHEVMTTCQYEFYQSDNLFAMETIYQDQHKSCPTKGIYYESFNLKRQLWESLINDYVEDDVDPGCHIYVDKMNEIKGMLSEEVADLSNLVVVYVADLTNKRGESHRREDISAFMLLDRPSGALNVYYPVIPVSEALTARIVGYVYGFATKIEIVAQSIGRLGFRKSFALASSTVEPDQLVWEAFFEILLGHDHKDHTDLVHLDTSTLLNQDSRLTLYSMTYNLRRFVIQKRASSLDEFFEGVCRLNDLDGFVWLLKTGYKTAQVIDAIIERSLLTKASSRIDLFNMVLSKNINTAFEKLIRSGHCEFALIEFIANLDDSRDHVTTDLTLELDEPIFGLKNLVINKADLYVNLAKHSENHGVWLKDDLKKHLLLRSAIFNRDAFKSLVKGGTNTFKSLAMEWANSMPENLSNALCTINLILFDAIGRNDIGQAWQAINLLLEKLSISKHLALLSQSTPNRRLRDFAFKIIDEAACMAADQGSALTARLLVVLSKALPVVFAADLIPDAGHNILVQSLRVLFQDWISVKFDMRLLTQDTL